MFGISDYVKVKSTDELVLIVDEDESAYHAKNQKGKISIIEKEEVREAEAEYLIPVTWEMCGVIRVRAKSATEALMKAEETFDDIEFPDDKEYVDGSMEVSDPQINRLHLYQQ